MSRPTSDDAMHSLAALRPFAALHPEEVFGPDYLQRLVEATTQTSGSGVDRDFGARIHDSGPRRTRVMAGTLAIVVVIAAVSTFLWTRSSPTTTTHGIQLSPWRTVAATFPIPFERQTSTSPQMSHDMTCPTASRMGDTVSETLIGRPLLVFRTVSKGVTEWPDCNCAAISSSSPCRASGIMRWMCWPTVSVAV